MVLCITVGIKYYQLVSIYEVFWFLCIELKANASQRRQQSYVTLNTFPHKIKRRIAVFHVAVAMPEVLTAWNNEFHLRLGRTSRGVTFTLVTEYDEEESEDRKEKGASSKRYQHIPRAEACKRKPGCTRSYSAVYTSSCVCTRMCARTHKWIFI